MKSVSMPLSSNSFEMKMDLSLKSELPNSSLCSFQYFKFEPVYTHHKTY